jgi:MFS family permease
VGDDRVPPVLSNQGFLLLWLAQIISQTAQNAILYALIIVVQERTGSTTNTSGVVLSFVFPIVVFGLFAGLLVDRWSKRRLLIITNVARTIAALAFLFARENVWAVYGVTVFFASSSQLFTTTSAASLPFMVKRSQLIAANTLYSGAFTIAQIAGLIILAPLILYASGAGALFTTAAAAFAIAAFLTRFIPHVSDDDAQHAHSLPRWGELRNAVSDFAKTFKNLRSDPLTTLAMGHITMSSTLILIFAILVPKYMQEILGVDAEDAVAVFAPVAFGALLGLRAVPWMVARYGKTRTVALGLFGIAVCVGVMGSVETIAALLERTDRLNPFEGAFGLSILVALTMAISGPMGLAYALLNTPAQTTLHERTPVEMRGRVIAAQMVFANGVAILPLVVVGGIADLYGVSTVVIAISVMLAFAGALSLYLERRWLHHEEGGAPPAGKDKRWRRQREPVPGSIDTT